jgi:thiol-disulfide isomerase/thioredoxin
VASNAAVEQAGNEEYRDDHMSAIFREGFSFSGFERDSLRLSLHGESFLDISGVSGIDSIGDGRGAAYADFDNDGDFDIFLVSLQGTAHHLFRNNVGQDGNFLRVSLRGTASGLDAYGAVVRVKTSAGVLTKVKAGGSGYLAQHDPRLLFGLGDDEAAEWVEVTWPGGAIQRLGPVAAGTSILVVESERGERRVAEIEERRFRLVDPVSAEDSLLARLEIERGAVFPDLPLFNPDGSSTGLHEILKTGRRTLVNLWATYCIPCRREMPELQRLAPALDASGIDLLGLSLDIDTSELVPAYLDSLGITYATYLSTGSGIADLYANGEVFIPLSILLDEHGRVSRVLGGWSPQTSAALEELAAGRNQPGLRQ